MLLYFSVFWGLLACSIAQFGPPPFPIEEKFDENKTYAGTYLIVAPRVVRPGLAYAVSLNILDKARTDNVVRVEIRDDQNRTLVSEIKTNVVPGVPVTVRIDEVPADRLVPGSAYKVYAKGEDLLGKIFFEHQEPVQYDAKSVSIFVQTDKAIYKPGGTVRFRVVIVNPNLTPIQGTVEIKIEDPNQNVISQYLEEPLSKGVASKELTITDDPPLGDWKIKVQTTDGQKYEKVFSVDRYVLPKFEVTIEPPPYITVDQDVAILVKAKYTYGKGVQGTVKLRAEYPWAYYGEDRKRAIEKTADLNNNGEKSIRFSNAELREQKLVTDYGYNTIKLTATVVESLTGIARNGTTELTTYKHATKVKLTTPTDTFKPGLEYNLLLSVVTQDDQPIPDSFPKKVQLIVQHYYPYDYEEGVTQRESEKDERIVTLEADGTKAITIKPPLGVERMNVEARYDKNENWDDTEIYAIQSIDASVSPTDSFLRLTADQGPVPAGVPVTFKVKSTQKISGISVQVVARGYVVYTKDIPMGDSLETSISFTTTEEMAPKSRVIVYAVRPDNKEVLVDAMDFKVEGLFRNKVGLRMNPEKAQPGDQVEITVSADPGSYVGLLAVDQSVLLLKSGNDITADLVESDIEQYDSTFGSGSGPYGGPFFGRPMERRRKRSAIWWPWWGIGGKDASTIFENAGLVVLTDALLYKQPRPPMPVYANVDMEMMGVGEAAGAEAPDEENEKSIETTETPIRVRQLFPETWVWSDQTVEENGQVVHRAAVPDTITSWITSAFAVHDESGLGVSANTAKLTVFRPFFIRLNLPYAVKRGEKLALQVLVFNYGEASQTATVTLRHDDTSGFDFIEKSGAEIKATLKDKPTKNYNVRQVQVPGGGGSTSVFFPIVPTEIGDVKLHVTARADTAGDAVEMPLKVEPEGFRVDYNRPLVVDLANDTDFEQTVNLQFPDDAVEGSQNAEVSVVGDIMGPVLQNVENLVRMPYGCGEQNMLNFVPNIVVMRYLTATQRLSTAIESKARKYMEAGYQRELTYKRDDNSFSAFGQSDKHGSTWLTAFVVRSFHQAKQYIFVDEKILADSVKFLNSQQKENGAFEERGEVHHKDMQGGSAQGGVPLTAYVLIALLENGQSNAEALNYIEQSLDSIKDNPYALAVATYALHLADSPKKDQALESLELKAKNENGNKYWSGTVGDEKPKDVPYYWDGPKPVDVEMTSYALLTYMRKGDVSGGLPIVRWMSSKRNAQGGFSSTQDTVMALQALGSYAEEAYDPEFDVTITARNGDWKKTFSVGPEEAILLQTAELPNLDEPVVISATGSGVVFAQVSWNYHLAKQRDDAPFDCDPKVFQNTPNDITVSLCCRFKEGRSNMVALEMEALTGYAYDAEEIFKLPAIKDLQRAELQKDDTKLDAYFNSLGTSPVCFNVTSQRVYPVADQKPSVIKVYDYYENNLRAEHRYQAAAPTLSETCDNCWRDIPGSGEGADNDESSDADRMRPDAGTDGQTSASGGETGDFAQGQTGGLR